jgi:hypothetical protein
MTSRNFAVALIIVALSVTPPIAISGYVRAPSVHVSAFDRYFRTELYFGMNKPGGGEVTTDQWAKFLTDEVTPRFPDGLTVIDAAGQFRSASGTIVQERSRMIILLYRKRDRESASRKINEIRAAYCKLFDQESVMRVDLRRSVEVSFE